MTSSSSAAARPASGSSATPPCGASGRSCVERVDLGQGTTGRFHGLLHSGGRYVTSRPPVGHRVRRGERRPAPHRRRGDRGHRRPVRHHAGRRPRLRRPVPRRLRAPPACRCRRSRSPRPWRASRGSTRASRAPSRWQDAVGRRLEAAVGQRPLGAASTARAILTYHWVTEILRDGDRVVGAVARDDRGGGEVRIEAAFIINAGGVWAGQIADMAGCPGVTVVPGKGIMIAMNHRLVSTVVNRCDPPGDGDILVPIRTVCVIGTTDVDADSPDDLDDRPRRGAADARRRRGPGAGLPPGAGAARLDRGAAAVQRRARLERRGRHPAHEPRPGGGGPPEARRRHGLPHDHRRQADHLPPDGARSWWTPCASSSARTRAVPHRRRRCCPGSEDGDHLLARRRAWRTREADLADDQLVCECELLPRRGDRGGRRGAGRG